MNTDTKVVETETQTIITTTIEKTPASQQGGVIYKTFSEGIEGTSVNGIRGRGTEENPEPIQAGDQIMMMTGFGIDSNGQMADKPAGSVAIIAESVGEGFVSGCIEFSTVDAEGNHAKRMILRPNGQLELIAQDGTVRVV